MNKIITLPDADTITAGLLKLDDNSHAAEQFYPHIAKHGGQKKTPEGIALLLTLAVTDYTRGLPPVISTMLMLNLSGFVRVLTGGDAEMGAAVMSVLRETGMISA